MFILRKTSQDPKNPLQFNLTLGESYSMVHKYDGENFESLREGYGSTGILYGFIVYHEGTDIFPLYEGFNYYVMASDGKTFANITLKK